MMMGVRASAAMAVATLVLLPTLGGAQVYRWEDEGGTVHFTNAPDRIPDPIRSQMGPLELAPRPDDAKVAPPDAPPAPPRALTRIPFSPGSPILVNARISDAAASVSLILDTGADRTIIAPQALWRLGISALNAPQALIKGVTGLGQGDIIQVTSIQVGEARVGPLRIVALDADLKQAEGLLGRDFLEHFTVTIDAREQVVTLTPK
jgi:hypothetical protein